MGGNESRQHSIPYGSKDSGSLPIYYFLLVTTLYIGEKRNVYNKLQIFFSFWEMAGSWVAIGNLPFLGVKSRNVYHSGFLTILGRDAGGWNGCGWMEWMRVDGKETSALSRQWGNRQWIAEQWIAGQWIAG